MSSKFTISFTLFAALTMGVASGCKEPIGPEPPVPADNDPVISIETVWLNGGEALELNKVFTDDAGYSMSLVELKYYLANIELKRDDGSYLKLSEIELFDHRSINPDLPTPQWDHAYSFKIPAGFYTAIRFGLGVPPALNGLDPANYDNQDPLSVYTNMYWSWASMYRFVILEANADTNGGNALVHPLIFHTGLDALYRPDIELPIDLVMDEGDAKDIVIAFDWNEIFYPESNPIDLITRNITHTTENEDDFQLSEDFTDNIVASVKLK